MKLALRLYNPFKGHCLWLFESGVVFIDWFDFPYDSNGDIPSVSVSPDVDDNFEIDIVESDLRLIPTEQVVRWSTREYDGFGCANNLLMSWFNVRQNDLSIK